MYIYICANVKLKKQSLENWCLPRELASTSDLPPARVCLGYRGGDMPILLRGIKTTITRSAVFCFLLPKKFQEKSCVPYAHS